MQHAPRDTCGMGTLNILIVNTVGDQRFEIAKRSRMEVFALQELRANEATNARLKRWAGTIWFRYYTGSYDKGATMTGSFVDKDVGHRPLLVSSIMGEEWRYVEGQPFLAFSFYTFQDRQDQKAMLKELLWQVRTMGRPYLLMGDFNATMGETHMASLELQGYLKRPTRKGGSRRIDYAIGWHIDLREQFEADGPRDHLLCGYVIETGSRGPKGGCRGAFRYRRMLRSTSRVSPSASPTGGSTGPSAGGAWMKTRRSCREWAKMR